MQVPEQAATAAIFGFVLSILALMLNHLGKQQRASDSRLAARDEKFVTALASAYELVRDLNERRVEEQRVIHRCMQEGLNGMFVSIKETNAELIAAGQDMVKEMRPALTASTVAIAEAKQVMLGFRQHNGHAKQ